VATFLGKDWEPLTRELVKRAEASGQLPDGAEYTIRQFLEDGIVVVAYTRIPGGRSGKGGNTAFYQIKVNNDGIVAKQLNNMTAPLPTSEALIF
jgi:L-asparaginase/Glu-tRNA(Gln) amidotransferase subunit D